MKKGSLLIGAGIVCLAAAAVLVGYNLWDDHRAGESAEAALTAVRQQMSAAPSETPAFVPALPEQTEESGEPDEENAENTEYTEADSDTQPGTGESSGAEQGVFPPESGTPDYVLNPRMDPPRAKVGQDCYIGVLEIPDAGLTLPIYDDYTEERLKSSPCRFSGSPYLSNMVIAGHNYGHHFSPIKKLSPGAEIRFTDMDGNCFVYSVSEIEIIGPEDVQAMTTGAWDLTLFTCTLDPPPRNRYTVRCVQIS